MYIAKIKYTRIAIPDEIPFETKEEAEAFAKNKESQNPYVRWTEIIEKEPTPST